MNPTPSYKRSFYFLLAMAIYIVLQFLWWGYMLVSESPKKMLMIVGEGGVFLVILIWGIWRYHKSIQRELSLHSRQSNFLLSVTHELKTPISAVQLILQTILKRPLDSAQVQIFVDKALDENKKSALLIENMLHAAGIENKRIQTHISLMTAEQFWKAFLDSLKSRYDTNQLQFTSETDIAFKADYHLLEQVLKQLIENSFKYGSDKVKVYFKTKSGMLCIEVKDNGEGVKEQDRPFIFDKFYRSGDENIRERTGTGLGLFIAREFIHLHGGTLTFNPNGIKGSVFTINLPL